MNQPIGIMDSGVGGLSIASVLIKKLPNESIIYLADSKNCPYGEKSKEEIYSLTKKMVKFLLKSRIKLLVVACNTITVASIDRLRTEFGQIPIVGIVPVIKTAREKTTNGKIGVFSTTATANSFYQKDLVNKFANDCSVLNLGSERLVPLIEKRNFESVDEVLKTELEPFKKAQIDTLALGCSHFPLIKDQIQRYLPGVLILDSSNAVSRQIQRILKQNKTLSNSTNPSYNFYTTGNLNALRYFAEKLTNKAKLSRISLQ